jgi:hypothetical protein
VSTAAAPAPSRAPALWLAVSQLVMLLSLVPWAMIAGLSLVADAGRAMLPAPVLWAAWIYPVLPLACAPLAWSALRRGDARRAVTLTTIPLLAAVPLLAYLWYMASPVG